MPQKIDEVSLVSDFFNKLSKSVVFYDRLSRKHIPCDFLGQDSEAWYMVEVKSSISDLEKSIMQILRYYKIFNNSIKQIESRCYSKMPRSNGGYQGINKSDREKLQNIYSKKQDFIFGDKKRINLIILYTNSIDLNSYIKYYSIYRDYIANPNCPQIDFYYLDESQNPVKL